MKQISTLASEFNKHFVSMNGVDVPERITVSRDDWRELYDAIVEEQKWSDRAEEIFAVDIEPDAPEISGCNHRTLYTGDAHAHPLIGLFLAVAKSVTHIVFVVTLSAIISCLVVLLFLLWLKYL